LVLTIKNKSEVLYLRLSNILYIQADGNYCDIYLADGGVLNTLTYQRAEIAKMMDEQIPEDIRKRFVLVGKSYMVNTDYVLRIQPSKQLLTFMVNQFGTTRKVSIKVTTKALTKLAEEMEMQTDEHAFRTP
jgi:DNA-binding LytR/AlgR family response regulator